MSDLRRDTLFAGSSQTRFRVGVSSQSPLLCGHSGADAMAGRGDARPSLRLSSRGSRAPGREALARWEAHHRDCCNKLALSLLHPSEVAWTWNSPETGRLGSDAPSEKRLALVKPLPYLKADEFPPNRLRSSGVHSLELSIAVQEERFRRQETDAGPER